MAAVQQNGYALQYVKDQTPEICIAALEQNPDARLYIKDPSLKLNNMDKSNEGDVKVQNPNLEPSLPTPAVINCRRGRSI